MIRLLTTVLLAACLPACEQADQSTPLTYVALGASDAVGIGAVPRTAGYVFLLGDRLTDAGFAVELHNLGLLGANADDIAARELPVAAAADPEVATLWTGANDLVNGRSPDLFARQLDGILAGLRSRTRAQIFVGDIPDLANAPLFKLDPDPDVTTGRIAAFNERIRALVVARGCVLVPLSTLPTDPSMFAIDGFHPSTLGHRRIADLFWEQIKTRI